MVKIQGIIPLVEQIEDLQVPIWFRTVQTWAVNVLLRTTYIDKCIRAMFAMEPTIVAEQLAQGAILVSYCGQYGHFIVAQSTFG